VLIDDAVVAEETDDFLRKRYITCAFSSRAGWSQLNAFPPTGSLTPAFSRFAFMSDWAASTDFAQPTRRGNFDP
jgi:hypothetical protein